MGATSITKGGLAEALAESTGLKKSECSKVLTSLGDVVATNLKKSGKVIVPGITRVVTRTKPATKAGKQLSSIEVFVFRRTRLSVRFCRMCCVLLDRKSGTSY